MSKVSACLASSPTAKNRKECIQTLMTMTELPKLDRSRLYYLTHTYNHDPNRKLYFLAPYDFDTLNAICAYIQFECAELDTCYSMDESEVIELLEIYYDCQSSFSANKPDVKKAEEIDLYINWETHCGSKVQLVDSLKRDGMDDYFKRYIEKFNSKGAEM